MLKMLKALLSKDANTISFTPEEPGAATTVAEFHGETSVLDLALANKIAISHSCGGMGSCGTCRVTVISDTELPERNEVESEIARDRGFTKYERLACQTTACAGLHVKVPPPQD